MPDPVRVEPPSRPVTNDGVEPGTGDTPLSWQVDGVGARRKRRMLIGGIAGAALAVGVLAFAMKGGTGTTNEPTNASGPAPGITTGPADAGAAVAETPADASTAITTATPPDASVDEDEIEMTTTVPVDAGVQSVARPAAGRPGGRPGGGRPGGRPGGSSGAGAKPTVTTDKPAGPDLDSPFPTE